MKYPEHEPDCQELNEKPQGWFYPNWITQLYQDRRINGEEMILLGIINAYYDKAKGGCWASNKALSKVWWGKQPTYVSTTLAKLSKMGLIKMKYWEKDGKTHRLILTTFQPHEAPPIKENHNTPFKKTTIPPLRKPQASHDSYSNEDIIHDPSQGSGSSKGSFGLETPIEEFEATPELVKEFYQFLNKVHQDIGRADLPRGTSLAAKRRRLKTKKKWEEETNLLLTQLKGNVSEFRKVMKWYFENHKKPFMPSCYALTTFREKFNTIVRQMKQQPAHEQDEDGTSREYRLGFNRERIPIKKGWVDADPDDQ